MRNEWTIDPDRGLWLFRASRLEALLDPLEALLTHLPPSGLLAPQTVLVGHPGLRPWLREALAARRGSEGIVANLEFALPSPWLDALALQQLDLPAPAARVWQREVLRWRLWRALPQLDDARVQAMLADDDGTQAFAFAERLSAVLAPLMLYREDWLQRWRQGLQAVSGEALLAAAWRLLDDAGTARLPHRGERLLHLARRLSDAQTRPVGLADDPLHVFGLHHLAPPELAVLRALSRWRPVVLHVADPCREHWLGMGTGRTAMREALAGDDLGEASFLALDHPLLAAWGRLGQHFLLSLDEGELAVNERHGGDAADAPPRHLLDRLQQSLRRNNPTLMRKDTSDGLDTLRDDASLRVHRCATPLRELEVLRDALAEAFAQLPGLQPADVVVLSPDPARYRPLMPAVFGEPGRRDGAWPWHAADVPLAATHPVYRALTQTLALPGTRLSASVVLDLLSHPALAHRFGLEGQDQGALRHALARLGVAWGFDADDRARFDAPAVAEHTFDWGLDRALAGHVFGEREATPLSLPDGVRMLPGEGIDADLAELLGRLHALLMVLRDWVALGDAPRPPEAWSTLLRRRIEALFDPPPGDTEAREALEHAIGRVVELGKEWAAAGLDAPLPWPAVRDALLAKLAAVPERQRFLVGGITFCGMVPQRAIPFRVVAVLGLDEGALPRHAADDGLDLRARAPRVGDRDLASDDRYLFLETLMAARDRLHLSFIGVGADDGRPRNPAGPLADLLDALARFVPPPGMDRPESGWPWERRATLQPRDVLAMPEPVVPASGTSCREAPGTASGASAQATEGPPDEAPPPSLDTLIAFFRDPARQVLRDVAGVRLDALEDARLEESEPLEPRPDPRDTLARRMVFATLERAAAAPPETPDEALLLGGRLPQGTLGEQLWRREREDAMVTLAKLRRATPAPREPLAAPRAVQVSVPLADGRCVEGAVEVREDADGVLWLIEAFPGKTRDRLHFGRRLPLLLRWLALRLAQTRPVRAMLVGASHADPVGEHLASMDATFLALTDPDARAAGVAGLRQPLDAAIAFRAAVLRGDARYAPATSWAAWRHATDEPEKVVATWTGGAHGLGERDYAPGYAALWGQTWHLVPGGDELENFARDADVLVEAFAPLLRGVDSDDEDGTTEAAE